MKPNQLQPIETAPRNAVGARSGPSVLVWDAYSGCVWTARWTTDTENGVVRTGWWVSAMGKKLLIGKFITHWASLTIPTEGEE